MGADSVTDISFILFLTVIWGLSGISTHDFNHCTNTQVSNRTPPQYLSRSLALFLCFGVLALLVFKVKAAHTKVLIAFDVLNKGVMFHILFPIQTLSYL